MFNLKKAFNSMKEAMAHVYDEQMQWWRIDEIEAGDPSWKQWVDGNPQQGLKPNKSLINALSDARNEYYRRKLFLRARYGVSDEEVKNFYKMYVGYSPMKGMYAMHIGPYNAMEESWSTTIEMLKNTGKSLNSQNLLELSDSIQLPEVPPEMNVDDPKFKAEPLVVEYKAKLRDKRRILEVRADLMNKFSYFLKTYNKLDRNNMNRGVNSYLQNLIKSVGTMFTQDDLGVIVKSFPPEDVGKLDGNIKWISTKFESINPDTPEGEKLMSSGVLLGQGSILTLNSRGINKLLQKTAQDGNWNDLYEKAIQMIATANNKTVEETKALVAEDRAFSDMFLDQLRGISEELKKAGDFRADFLKVALDRSPKRVPKVGAQRTQTYRISKTQRSIINLKLEILKAIVDLKTEDPNQIAESLNAARKMHKTKAKGKLDADLVKMWIDAIKSEDQQIQKMKKKKQVRTYQEIYDTTVSDLENMNSGESLRDAGQDDLATAFRLASTTFMESPLEFIDPKNKTKLQLPDAPNMFAREGDPDVPVSAKHMTELRVVARKKGTEEDLKKALKAEIQKEIGSKQVSTEGGLQDNVVSDPVVDGEEEKQLSS